MLIYVMLVHMYAVAHSYAVCYAMLCSMLCYAMHACIDIFYEYESVVYKMYNNVRLLLIQWKYVVYIDHKIIVI